MTLMVEKKRENIHTEKHTKHQNWMNEVNAELIIEVLMQSYLPIIKMSHVGQVLYFLKLLLIFLNGVNDDKN